MKRKNVIMMIAIMLFAAFTMKPVTTQAASKNAAAHKAYQKKMQAICATEFSFHEPEINYKYVDLTGNGVHEILMVYHTFTGSSDDVKVYTYKKGKAVCVLSDKIYGIEKVTYYKKSDGLVIYSVGHGSEVYRYYKMSGGKYKAKGIKIRRSQAGGYMTTEPWEYYSKNYEKSLSYSTFKKNIKSIQKGSKKSFNASYHKMNIYK